MEKSVIFSVLLCVVCAFLSEQGSRAAGPRHGKKVVCYFASWAVRYEGRAKFTVEDAEPAAEYCTHLVYLFVGLDSQRNTLKVLDPQAAFPLDDNSGFDLLRKLINLKQTHDHLKVFVCIGGWEEGSVPYSKMAESEVTRKIFIDSVKEFLSKHKLDGIEISWQFPGDRGGSPNDKYNLVQLIKEMKSALDPIGKEVAVAVSSIESRINLGVDIVELSDYASYISVLAYEYHGFWDREASVSAPLKSKDKSDVEQTLKLYKKTGVDMSKLILGISSFVTTNTLESPASIVEDTIGKPAKGRPAAGFRDESGFLNYNEVCVLESVESMGKGWFKMWDKLSKTPYLVNGMKFISYDDPTSVSEKIKMAIEWKNMGGVMYYSIDKDDFHGDCGEKFGILKAINKQLEESSRISKKLVCYVPSWGFQLNDPARYSFESMKEIVPTCTHLVYLFARIDGSTHKITVALEEHNNQGLIDEMLELRKSNPKLKVFMCVGGWDEGVVNFSKMVKTRETRQTFINSVRELLKRLKLNGIEVNWQFPGESNRGGVPEDKENLVHLIKELKAALAPHNLEVSLAISSFPDRINRGFNLAVLTKYVSHLSVLSFEYHIHWDGKAGSTTPMRSTDDRNIESTYRTLQEHGAEMNKVLLGVSSYGTTFYLKNSTINHNQITGADVKPYSFRGGYHATEGFIAYNEACPYEKDAHWTKVWDETSGTPYLINGEKVISYDDPTSIAEKMKFIEEKQLGGAIYYSVEKDDFHGSCGNGKNPILQAIRRGFEENKNLINIDEIRQKLQSQSANVFWNNPLAAK